MLLGVIWIFKTIDTDLCADARSTDPAAAQNPWAQGLHQPQPPSDARHRTWRVAGKLLQVFYLNWSLL